MFERYAEDARRVVFFARYEASQEGSREITSEHFLLGFLHDRDAAVNQLFHLMDRAEEVREGIHKVGNESISTSVDLPLNNVSKRILAYAAEESREMQQEWIGSEHLLLGMLREKCPAGARLEKLGITLETARATIAATPISRPHEPPREPRLTAQTGVTRAVVVPRLSFVQRYAFLLILAAFVAGVIMGVLLK